MAFEEDVQIELLDANGLIADISSRVEQVSAEPRILALVDFPGGAWVAEDLERPGEWLFALGELVVPLTWSPNGGHHAVSAGGFTVQITYDAIQSDVIPGGRAKMAPIITEGVRTGLGFASDRQGPIPFVDVQFYQFATSCLTWKGIAVPSGALVEGKAPDGTSVPNPGVGGMRIDGAQSQVDTVNPPAPGNDGRYPFVEEGPDGVTMTDTPQFPVAAAPGLHARCGAPSYVIIYEMTLHAAFTTYMVVDGEVSWRSEWSYERTFRRSGPGAPWTGDPPVMGGPDVPTPGYPGGTPAGFPTDAMDFHGALALLMFQNGNPAGAPLQ